MQEIGDTSIIERARGWEIAAVRTSAVDGKFSRFYFIWRGAKWCRENKRLLLFRVGISDPKKASTSDDSWRQFFAMCVSELIKNRECAIAAIDIFGVIDILLRLYNQPTVRLKQVHTLDVYLIDLYHLYERQSKWLAVRAMCVCLYLFVAHYCATRGGPYLSPMLFFGRVMCVRAVFISRRRRYV